MSTVEICVIVFGVIITISILATMSAIKKELRQKNILHAAQLDAMPVATVEYDEQEIIAHLDYIVTEAISTYILLNITSKQAYYINSKMEKEMIEKLQNDIPEQISATLLTKLCYIYSRDYVGKFIGQYIYMKITETIVDFNLNNQKNNGAK